MAAAAAPQAFHLRPVLAPVPPPPVKSSSPLAKAPSIQTIDVVDIGAEQNYDVKNSPADRSRILRSDGTLFSNVNPGKRVFETGGKGDDPFSGRWLERELELKEALFKDPRYNMAFAVAGLTSRTVQQLILDPLQYAKPAATRNRQTTLGEVLRDLYGGDEIPLQYSKSKVEKMIADSFPEAKGEDDDEVVAFDNLRKLCDDLIRRNRTDVPVKPEIGRATQRENQVYEQRMADVRIRMRRDYENRLNGFYAASITHFHMPSDYRDLSETRQRLAESIIADERKWLPYNIDLTNGGAVAFTDREVKTIVQAKQQRPKLPQQLLPERQVNLRWISLPEHLGKIYFNETMTAHVQSSLHQVQYRSGNPDVTLEELITSEEVMQPFFELVALNLRISELKAPRRNEETKVLLPELARERLARQLLFTTMVRSAADGKTLRFHGALNLLSARRLSREDGEAEVYVADVGLYKKRKALNGREAEEVARQEAFIEML